ncbi:hypothetical protein V6K52_14760 [Knoellia sp. S7-12]|uniref:hypothetical protein n=1 Tax=Knoellia sp. S7-12 TaxID=3126698 RepID=UPI003367A8DC
MGNTSSHDTQQARAALDQADRIALATDRDRRVHGLATAVFGAVMGIYVAAHRFVDGQGWAESGLFGAYVVILMALAVWQRRAANTTPRGARHIGYVGLAGSAVLMIASVVWLNLRQGDNRVAGIGEQPDHWWVYAIVAVVTALPSLAAGHVIFYGRRA